MTNTVIVFDFDGTLVDSNPIKRRVYFALFPQDEFHAACVRHVLNTASVEDSRYEIFPKILNAIGESPANPDERVQQLVEQYNHAVVEAIKTCPECPGAESVLRQLSPDYALYLSSTTPEASLQEVVRFRGWDQYFRAILGYPCKKVATLRAIMQHEQATPEQMLVVGDGESDRRSAETVGCRFWDVNTHPLAELRKYV